MSLLQLHVHVTVLVLLVSETRQFSSVSSSHFGTFDFAELENAAYEVDIASTPMSELQFENDAMHMTILSRHGQRYCCSLPPPLPPPLNEEEEEAGKEGRLSSEKLPNVSHLLQPLSERACLIKTVGWWTYEYCHGKFVRQYHMEAGRIVGETKYLGFYERETDWDQNHITRIKGLLDSFKDSLAGAMPRAYHTMFYVNGTECDITHQSRAAQVELYCTVQGIDKLVEVQEGNTCNYTLSVQTPLLCQHPMLAPRDDSIARHTLSCTPVLSQLDYEDYLLKQELIRQQKEKLSALQSSDESAESKGSSGSDSDSDGGSLTSGERQLLRKLVMKSITQLAQIASGSLYDSGYLDDPDGVDIDIELDLDEINDDDIEAAGMGNLKTGNGGGEGGDGEKRGSLAGSGEDSRLEGGGRGERSGAGRRQEVQESSQDARADGRVSDKMKKMASDVKTTGRDSALESLLTNLATTAEYIESLENPPQATESAHDNSIPREVAKGFQTGDDSQHENTRERSGGDGDASSPDVSRVRGPQADDENLNQVRRTDTSSSGKYVSSKRTIDNEAAQNYGGGGGGDGTTVGSEWATAGKGEGETRTENVEEEENVQELDQLDPELVREMEQQMEKTLGRQLDTDAEIKVKIITIREDQLKELTEEVEREGKEGREGDGGDKESVEADSDLSETVASAVSRLLDRLLNDEDDSVYEDKIKQSDLEASYDQVWGDRRKERRNNGR